MFRRVKPAKPVRVEIANGFGWPMQVVELTPGKESVVTVAMTQNVCDRGFPSEDGVHRLTSHTYEIPLRLTLKADR